MKLLISTLVALVALMLPASAYAWSEEVDDSADDAYLYETTYNQCVFRYEQSAHSDSAIHCVCNLLANHAVQHRGEPAEQVPPVLEKDEQSCLRR